MKLRAQLNAIATRRKFAELLVEGTPSVRAAAQSRCLLYPRKQTCAVQLADVRFGSEADICSAAGESPLKGQKRTFDWTIYAQLNRSRIDLPITQSLSSSDKNDNSSVKWEMRCL